MFCSKCGSKVREGARFCSTCGNAMPAPAPVAPEAVTPEPVAPEAVASEAVAPEAVTPEPVAPEAVTPEPVAPEAVAPEAVAPEAVAPEVVAPEAVAPEAVAPEPVMPPPIMSEPVMPPPVMPEAAMSEPVGTATMVAEKPSAPIAFEEGFPYPTEPDSESESAEQKPKGRAGRIIGTIALCLSLFLFSSLAGISYLARTTFSEDSISAAFAELDFGAILSEVNATDAVLDYVDPMLIREKELDATAISNAATICHAVNTHNSIISNESDKITAIPSSLAGGMGTKTWDLSVYADTPTANSTPDVLDSTALGSADIALVVVFTGDEWADAFEMVVPGNSWTVGEASPKMTPEMIGDFLKGDAFKKFVEESILGYTNALLDGNVAYALSGEDILDFCKSNEALIFEELGYQMTDYDYDYIETYLEDMDWEDEQSLQSILGDAHMDTWLWQVALSNISFYVLAGLAALSLLGLIIVNRKHFKTTLISTGISVSLAGGLHLAIGLMLIKLLSMAFDGSVLSGVAEHFFLPTKILAIVIGVGALAAGIAIILIYIVAVSFSKKKAAKEQPQPV